MRWRPPRLEMRAGVRWVPIWRIFAESSPRTRRATYQDVLDAPAHRVAEVIDGTLYTQPRPAPPHAERSLALSNDFSRTSATSSSP